MHLRPHIFYFHILGPGLAVVLYPECHSVLYVKIIGDLTDLDKSSSLCFKSIDEAVGNRCMFTESLQILF